MLASLHSVPTSSIIFWYHFSPWAKKLGVLAEHCHNACHMVLDEIIGEHRSLAYVQATSKVDKGVKQTLLTEVEDLKNRALD